MQGLAAAPWTTRRGSAAAPWTSGAAPLQLPGRLRRRQGPVAAGGHGAEASTPTSHLHRGSLTLTASVVAKVYESSSSFSTQNSSACWTGSSSEAQKIREAAERNNWSETFELDLKALEKPLGPITRQRSWACCLGRPMKQGKRDTCVLVSCTIAIDAAHRLHGEAVRMDGAHPKHPDEWLFDECSLDNVWTSDRGAEVDKVLAKIKQLGGVPVTKMTTADAPAIQTEFLLPLRSWEKHAAGELTPEPVAALLDRHGPCVGLLWVCPWYGYFDAARDGGTLVYRGCGRSDADRRKSKELYGHRWPVGWHTVVCYEYRFCGEEMHVLVLDNYDETGPRRWVHVNDLDTLHTIEV